MKIITEKARLDAIGDACRRKTWSTTRYKLDEIPAVIDSTSSYNVKTENEWAAMTFAEKKNSGLTLIGNAGDLGGKYYDYSGLSGQYHIEDNNVVSLFDGLGLNFFAFYSNTSGDRASAGGRGVTWNTDDYRVICNALPENGGWGFFMAFALNVEALEGTDTQYYEIEQVGDYDMYCAGNFPGARSNNSDVTFVHDGDTYTLQSMYQLDEYTLRYDAGQSVSAFYFMPEYDDVLKSIYAFLVDHAAS